MNDKLGIIGGSGLYNLPELETIERKAVQTPYGPPSDELTIGRLHGLDLVFLPRHGAGHRHTPSELPYQANIYALKQLGITHLLTVSAVGSLQEDLPPLTLVLPDQIIDRTLIRPRSFFDNGVVAHVGIANPFCPNFQTTIAEAAGRLGVSIIRGGSYVCIEGPQFSTRAESNLYRSWGASVIGMTAMPEARLAREAELCYATIAMVTDYDVWHETEDAVTVDIVIANLLRNAETARSILTEISRGRLSERTCPCGDALANAIVTDRNFITPEIRDRLGVIGERYLSATHAK
jgi:5'-methylthioadenosine phosphorylase